MLDRIGRRTRFQRAPTGKRLVLVDRDLVILQRLYRYRYLRRPQLVELLKPKSTKRLVERLGDLFHETGLINRPIVQHRHFDSRCTPMIYEISNAGIRYLESLNVLPHRAGTFSRRASRGNNPQLLHTMMIIDALVKIELLTLQSPDLRFVPVDEILSRAPGETQVASNPLSVPVTIRPCREFPDIKSRFDTHIIPDGLYGIEYLIHGNKRYRFWALECERTSPAHRSTPRVSSKSLKQAAYKALIQSKQFKKHWGIPNLKLHLITQNDPVG